MIYSTIYRAGVLFLLRTYFLLTADASLCLTLHARGAWKARSNRTERSGEKTGTSHFPDHLSKRLKNTVYRSFYGRLGITICNRFAHQNGGRPSSQIWLVISNLVEGERGRNLIWKVSWLEQRLSLLRKVSKGNRMFPFSAGILLQAKDLHIVNTDQGKGAVLPHFQVSVWHLQTTGYGHLGLNSAQVSLNSAQVSLNNAQFGLNNAQVSLNNAQVSLNQVTLRLAWITFRLAWITLMLAWITLSLAWIALRLAWIGRGDRVTHCLFVGFSLWRINKWIGTKRKWLTVKSMHRCQKSSIRTDYYQSKWKNSEITIYERTSPGTLLWNKKNKSPQTSSEVSLP